jgi:hypothetical protein
MKKQNQIKRTRLVKKLNFSQTPEYQAIGAKINQYTRPSQILCYSECYDSPLYFGELFLNLMIYKG